MPDMPSFEILRNGWFLHDLAGSMGVCYVALSGLVKIMIVTDILFS